MARLGRRFPVRPRYTRPFGAPEPGIRLTGVGVGADSTISTYTANYQSSGIIAGDLLILVVYIRPGGNLPAAGVVDTPSGWTSVGAFRSEGGDQAADAGDSKIHIFSKVAAGTENGGTLDLTTSTVSNWVADIYGLTCATQQWSTTFSSGEKTVGTGNAAITMSTDPGLAAGDFLIASFMSVTDLDSAPFSSPTITATGATVATPTERRRTATSGGNDGASYGVTAKVTAGPGSTAPTFNFTVTGSGNHVGAAVIVSVREAAGAQRLWTGIPTSTIAYAGAKVTGGTNARMKVSTTSDLLTSPVFGGSATIDSNKYVQMSTTGLTANTTYYYGVEIDGNLDAKRGKFKTAPTTATSFSFAFSSCQTSGQTVDTYGRILARNPAFMLHLGDWHYDDINSTTASLYHTALEQPFGLGDDFGNLLQNVPTAWAWSDHDFCGNNSDNTATGKATVQAVHRQLCPSGTLPVSDGIYRTFVWGRVRFIITDTRSFRSPSGDTDNSSKTILGTTQKQWFKDQIRAATEPLIFWSGDSPWTDEPSPADEWARYNTERQELGDYIKSSGKNVVYLHGDSHSLAAHNGRGTTSPGNLKVFAAAPFHRFIGTVKGTYTSGPYPTDGATGGFWQYGWVTITDDGTTITAAYSGYDKVDTIQVSDSANFTRETVGPMSSQL